MIAKKIHHTVAGMATTKGIVMLFLVSHAVLLVMMVYTFPQINATFGTQAFDLKTFGYSESEAQVMLQNLDQQTIDLYLFPQLFLLDILYPILLALFLSALLIRLTTVLKINPHPIVSNLFLLPFVAMTFDYLENILISVMILNTTHVSSGIIKAASLFTQMKAAATTLSWLAILVLVVIWLLNNRKNK